MARKKVSSKRRGIKILRLFFGLVFSFAIQYLRARIAGRTYDFFEDENRNRQRAIKIRETALEMGGVLIKVGQFLSSRVDLLPSEYIEELALLQDEVPGVPFAEVRTTVERELGAPIDRLYSSFDTQPLAAASLGQVHRASLSTGQHVAVKVQRPNMEAIVEADLGSIRYIVHWLDRYTPLGRRADLPGVLAEFEETLRLELDYRQEAHHAERLSVMLRDMEHVRVPRIFWSHTSTRTLTMEYIAGIKVTDFDSIERQGISRAVVAEVLMTAYLRQILADGFFHADPHPGNIFVQPGPIVVLLDFGMVGEILPQTRENLRQVFLGVIRKDYDQVVLALRRLGFFTRDVDVHSLRSALAWTVETFYEMSLGELQSVDPRHVIDQLQDVFFAESFQIPANYAFLGRALGTLSGLCTALDPSFQFVTVAEPFARDLLQRERGLRGVVKLATTEARALATAAYNLPFLAEHLMRDVQTGEVNFRHQFDEVVHSVDRVERSMSRLLHGVLVIGFLIAGTLIFKTQYRWAAVAAFVLALLFLLRVTVPVHRRRRVRS